MPKNAEMPEWREPTQARSRARVLSILDAASELAVETGSMDLKMTDVAERARVPVGSLYQFFPNRTALIARLFAREMAPIDAALKEGLARAMSTEDIIGGVGAQIRASLAFVKAQPGLLVIWSSPAMDPVIQEADLQNSKANANAIAARAQELADHRFDEQALREATLLACHLWGQVIRLCVMIENSDPDNSVLEQYIGMIEGRFREILR